MKKFIKICLTGTVSVITLLFTIIPEDFFKIVVLFQQLSGVINTIINRVLFSVCIFIVATIAIGIYRAVRYKTRLKGNDYIIEIRYGNIFRLKNCKKVISFDECFSTSVGQAPSDINPDSVCGQFLINNPELNIEELILKNGLKAKGKSKHMGRDKYESGSVLPYNDYLLMAFAKLDKDGLGKMTFEEFRDSLDLLWEEIDKHYGQKDVCIPIIGSGVTRLSDVSLSKQELLDVIIASYKLSRNKIHKPCKLIIVCRKKDISLNKIGSYI